MQIEEAVTANYARDGIVDGVLDQVRRQRTGDGKPLTAMDLAGADQLHIGGLSATLAFGRSLGFAPGSRVIDLGCGIGGPARVFAEGLSVDVTGVDLLDDYVAAANELSRRVGVDSRCRFVQASVLSLPFAAETFDGAYMISLGINVTDKASVFREARRVVKRGSRFGVCDPMRVGKGDVRYPLPWAATAAGNCLEPLSAYRDLIATAGFEIESVVEQGAIARRHFKRAGENPADAPRVDLTALFGEETSDRVANIAAAVEAGIIAPVEIIARAA